jgi:hypothetical protein
MHWMLLPLDANASRHLPDYQEPPRGSWRDWLHDCWSRVRQFAGLGTH